MSLVIALAQYNFTVGDIRGNIDKIIKAYHDILSGADQKPNIIIFSEMCVTGYPPEDLVLRKHFQDTAMQAVETLASVTQEGTAMLIGGLWKESGGALYNTAFLLDEGRIVHKQYKHHLPNYGVFDEKRVFAPGDLPKPLEWRGIKLGVLVCEDMWQANITRHLKAAGAELFISINASPYEMGKAKSRRVIAQERVKETGLPLIYLNQIGGQDELVFDGRSFVMSKYGEFCCKLSAFTEENTISHWKKENDGWHCLPGLMARALNDEETFYEAMVLGLRDYVNKNRFPGVVLGLSGGIDSALTAAVAVDALGSSRVHAVMMPSPYTSPESLEDAEECAKRLKIRLDSISITAAMQTMGSILSPVLGSFPQSSGADTTPENIQARLRGAILMAISNKSGFLVLTTGNKSEMSVGYATLYGDMCGGFSVLKDVYKTTIYKLCNWRNQQEEVIPPRIITKAPSAELRPNQKDQDSLPPYDVLDAILQQLVEGQQSTAAIIAKGFDRSMVERVGQMLYAAEYKRRQAPPGVKITGMSFGRDRRYPITNGWKA